MTPDEAAMSVLAVTPDKAAMPLLAVTPDKAAVPLLAVTPDKAAMHLNHRPNAGHGKHLLQAPSTSTFYRIEGSQQGNDQYVSLHGTGLTFAAVAWHACR